MVAPIPSHGVDIIAVDSFPRDQEWTIIFSFFLYHATIHGACCCCHCDKINQRSKILKGRKSVYIETGPVHRAIVALPCRFADPMTEYDTELSGYASISALSKSSPPFSTHI